MTLVVTICSIVVVSVLLAVRSLRHLEAKKEIREVKDELKKGKVIYQSDSSSVPAESPSSSSSS